MGIVKSPITSKSASDVINYIKYDEDGYDRTTISSSKNCFEHSAAKEIVENAKKFGKQKNVQVYHNIISFHSDELDPTKDEDLQKGLAIVDRAMDLAYGENRMRYTVGHGDTGNMHFHSAQGNVDVITGKCITGDMAKHDNLIECMNQAMHEYGVKNVLLDVNYQNETDITKKSYTSTNEAKNQARQMIASGLEDGCTDYAELGEFISKNYADANLFSVEHDNGDIGHVIELTPEKTIKNNKNKENIFRCGLSKLGKAFKPKELNKVFENNLMARKSEEKAKQEHEKLMNELNELKNININNIEREEDNGTTRKENNEFEREYEYRPNTGSSTRDTKGNDGNQNSTELDRSRTGEVEDNNDLRERLQRIMQENARQLNEDAIDEELDRRNDGRKDSRNDRIISTREPAIRVGGESNDIEVDGGGDFDFGF